MRRILRRLRGCTYDKVLLKTILFIVFGVTELIIVFIQPFTMFLWVKEMLHEVVEST